MDRKKVKSQKLKVKSYYFAFLMPQALAQTPHELGPIGGERDSGLGPWSWLFQEKDVSMSAAIFTSIISRIIGIMTIIAGIWFIFQFIIGAYSYMTAAGDQQKMSNATKKITSALIGLTIIVAAYAIISLLGALLGFEILKPGEVIKILGPT